jgi:hypothetical protein
VRELLLQAFPFPSTLGEVTPHLLSQACLFIYSSHEKWVFPPLLCFPPTAAFTSFLTPDCWACAAASALSSRLVVREFPSPLFSAQGSLPSLLRVFFVVIAYYSVFFFFPWVGIRSYADLAQCCLWEYHVPLISPCGLHLPKQSGHWCLVVAWEHSWFFHLT